MNNHNNACFSQGIKTIVIFYMVNQPVDLLLWDNVRCGLHLKMKVCGVGSDMHRV